MLPRATHLGCKRLIDSILLNFIFLLFIYLVVISAQSQLQSVSDNDAFEPKYCKKTCCWGTTKGTLKPTYMSTGAKSSKALMPIH